MPKKLLCLPTSERSTRLSLSLWERELRPSTVTVGKRASSFDCHCGKESFVLRLSLWESKRASSGSTHISRACSRVTSEHVCVSHDCLVFLVKPTGHESAATPFRFPFRGRVAASHRYT